MEQLVPSALPPLRPACVVCVLVSAHSSVPRKDLECVLYIRMCSLYSSLLRAQPRDSGWISNGMFINVEHEAKTEKIQSHHTPSAAAACGLRTAPLPQAVTGKQMAMAR